MKPDEPIFLIRALHATSADLASALQLLIKVRILHKTLCLLTLKMLKFCDQHKKISPKLRNAHSFDILREYQTLGHPKLSQ